MVITRARILAVAAAIAVAMSLVPGTRAVGQSDEVVPVPQADCGPGSDPETAEQGRVPASDYESGRTSRPYTCNTEVVGHVPGTGGFKVHRFVDAQGTECAFYDTNFLLPLDVLNQLSSQGLGVAVLDMSDPANPVQTTSLETPAMLSPHESLSLNQDRGLLAAVLGTAATYPGVVDLYDVSQDCTDPTLLSSTPVGFLGHEAGFAPDGMTFYTAGTAFSSIAAVDVSDPTAPVPLVVENLQSHGIRISDDGSRAYFTPLDVGAQVLPSNTTEFNSGIAVVDVSSIQDRDPDPHMEIISELTWPYASISQAAIPVTIDGSPYLVEVDEFVNLNHFADPLATAPGSARIIDISDETAPEVVSTIHLEVHDPAIRPGLADDPGASQAYQGYSAHYCAVPQRQDPGIVACSMIGSGLRVFDIRDPEDPAEIAYFNAPPSNSSPANFEGAPLAVSAPAFVPERSEIWYSDNASGFWAVRVTNDVWPFAGRAEPSAAASDEATEPDPGVGDDATAVAGAPTPATGNRVAVGLLGAVTLLAGAALAHRRRWT